MIWQLRILHLSYKNKIFMPALYKLLKKNIYMLEEYKLDMPTEYVLEIFMNYPEEL